MTSRFSSVTRMYANCSEWRGATPMVVSRLAWCSSAGSCGGGRRNPALMAALARRLGCPVRPVEAVGWDGDALEAQAFAYLAVRSLEGLPLSLPSTTGVTRPMAGGRLFTGSR